MPSRLSWPNIGSQTQPPSINAKRTRVHLGTSDLFGEMELAEPMPVPIEVARCPECNSPLTWQVTSEDPDLGGLVVDCKGQDRRPENMRRHRYWQAEWQPIFNRVRAHVRRCAFSPNSGQLHPDVNSKTP